jgi:hypothetical protein
MESKEANHRTKKKTRHWTLTWISWFWCIYSCYRTTCLDIFAHHSGGSECESLAQRRKIARKGALYKVYTGDRAWKAIGVILPAPSYFSRVDHCWKIRARKQRTDIGKYSFVNRSISDWNKLPEVAIGTSHGKTYIFKTTTRMWKPVRGSEGDKK